MSKRYLSQKIKLQHLKAVDVISAHNSLLKASAFLGMSQPALTKSLKDLEDVIGLLLFDRHSRGVHSTQAGLLVTRAARQIFAELARLDDELDLLISPTQGSVALGALPVAATGILPGVLIRLQKSHPDLRVRLHQGRTEELLPLLASGELDMIVGRLYEPASLDGFRRESLWAEPIAILARVEHPIFSLSVITIEALRQYDVVLPTLGQRVSREIDQMMHDMGLEAAAALRSDSYGFIREMLHGSDLISIMPSLMMAGDLTRGTLRVVPLQTSMPHRPAGVILRPDGDLLPASQVLLACLRTHVGELATLNLAGITIIDNRIWKIDTI